MSPDIPGWLVVVPLKPLANAKSRLQVSQQQRRTLMQAFAQDAIAAWLGVAEVTEVLVIADDSWQHALPAGVLRRPDEGGDVNHALVRALAATAGDRRTVIAVGDLPCLTTAAAERTLARADVLLADTREVVVPDRSGLGTTVLLGRAKDLEPRFGDDSFTAHESGGAVPWRDEPRLRLDVDSLADLAAAQALGVGPATRRALADTPPTG